MIYKILPKAEFRKFVEILIASTEVIGPKRVDTRVDGSPIHHYRPVSSFEEIDLDYEYSEASAKTYFLPYKEPLSSFKITENDWTQTISYHIQPRAIIGLHACDISALLKLDEIMAGDFFPSPYYISRRKNTFIVGIDHYPCKGGFCRSLRSDTVERGFDLFLTDLGDRYFVAVASESGFNLLQKVQVRDVVADDTHDYLTVRKQIAVGFETMLDAEQLPRVLDLQFESDIWKKWGGKCLHCGSCAMVCPTCYCYGVNEYVTLDFKTATKVKQLHSCSLVDFAVVAGGHNFRPDGTTRLKYRYYHQLRGFSEPSDKPLCVGCGRCGRTCLAGINPPDVIRDLLAEEVGS
jgi:ferredoxin